MIVAGLLVASSSEALARLDLAFKRWALGVELGFESGKGSVWVSEFSTGRFLTFVLGALYFVLVAYLCSSNKT